MIATKSIMQDRYIELDSVNIRYWSMGEGEPIILLHGGNSCLEIWSFNISELAKHYRVYAFDMVGHGLSDKPEADYSLDYQKEKYVTFWFDDKCFSSQRTHAMFHPPKLS